MLDQSLSIPYQCGAASCNLTPDTSKELSGYNLQWLTHLSVEKDKRNQGEASKLLNQLGREADAAQTAIILEARGIDDDIDKERLMSLYKRNGFVKVQDEPTLMLRVPVPPMLFEQLKKKETSRIITDIYS